MKRLLFMGIAIALFPSIAPAQTRGVHRSSTTVHRGGTSVHRSTTTVHRSTSTVHAGGAGRAVATRYHPGNWHGRAVAGGVYHYPHGYTYHRWVVGRPLPRAFLAPAYFYAGYAALGLIAPPPNYQWVRYGPDLLLVDLSTGNVVDIRYGVFQ